MTSKVGILFTAGLALLAVSLSLAWWEPLLAPLAPLLALFAALLLWSPEWGAILILCSLYNPLVAYTRLGQEEWSLLLTYLLAAATVAVLLIRPARKGFFQRTWFPFWLLGLFSATVVLAALVGLGRGNPIHYVLSDLSQMGEFALVFLVALELGFRTSSVGKVLAVPLLVFAATLAWEQALYWLVAGGFLAAAPWGGGIRTALLAEGRTLAAFSPAPALVLPMIASVFIFGRRTLPIWVRTTILLCLPMGVLSVVFSFKRSVWIAEAAGFAMLFLMALKLWGIKRAGRYGFAVGSGVLMALAFLALVRIDDRSLLSLAISRLEYTFVQIEGSLPGVESRASELSATLEGLKSSPLLGRGLGALYVGYSRGNVQEKHFMHNTFLSLLYRMGVFGLLMVTGLMFVFLVVVWNRLSRAERGFGKALASGALASLVVMVLLAVTTGTLFTHPYAAYAGFLCAWAYSFSASPRAIATLRPALAPALDAAGGEDWGTGVEGLT